MASAIRAIGLAMVLAAGVAPASQAATYVGTRSINGTLADLTFVTDGTIGALSASNLLSFSVTFPQSTGPVTLSKGTDAFLYNFGLSATANEIRFATDQASAMSLFKPGTNNAYCINGISGACLGNGQRTEYILFPGTLAVGSLASGMVTLATLSNGVVPEPASWAMLIMGFGVVGAAARRQRRAVQA